MAPLLAAIEAGGTKFIVAVGTSPDDLREVRRIPTTDPHGTLAAVTAHLQDCQERHGAITALGIGTFGPAGVSPGTPEYGRITTTPKPGWANTDLLGWLGRAFDVPLAIDTDVNAAALAEARWGAGRDVDTVLYLTIGTGIGGGFFSQGKLLHGLLHPEMGHIRIPHDLQRDPFSGSCPWHQDCLEGLASGPAIEQRWKCQGEALPPEHPAWELEAHYLGTACANFLCTLSPQKIILGGGVMEVPGLLEKVRAATAEQLGNYLQHPAIQSGLQTLLVHPGLGSRAGLCGALALAMGAIGFQPSAA